MTELSNRPFRAGHSNTCHDCPKPILKDDWILAVRRGNHLWVIHERCPK